MGELDRIRWRCRRGMLELDIAIGEFFDRHYLELSEEDKVAFQALLEEKDQDIQGWLYGTETPEREDLQRILAVLRAHAAD